VLPHPATSTQITATPSAAVGWRMCSSHCGRAQPISAPRCPPRRGAWIPMVQWCRRRRCEIDGVSW